MTAELENEKASAYLVRQVLLEYLRASSVVGWPGTDGLTDDDIIDCYPRAISSGEAPGWHDLQIRFPELASALQALRLAKGWLATVPGNPADRLPDPEEAYTNNCRLSRWLVSFASGSGWYAVGEFIALDAASAIERAIELFGPGAGYRAEEIPWDAAPLSRANTAAISD